MTKVFSLVIVLLLFSGCLKEATPIKEQQQSPPLRVGVSPDYPPMAFIRDGKLQGIEIDLAHAIEPIIGRKIRFVRLKWEELYPALESGSIDVVMSGVSLTKKRSKWVAFSRAYTTISQMTLMREGDRALDIVMEGENQRVAVLDHTTAKAYADIALKKATRVKVTSTADAIAKLYAGEVDYYIADSPEIWYYTADNRLRGLIGYFVPLTTESIAWAFKKENTGLLNSLNNALDEVEKRGELAAILSKWIPFKVLQMPQSQPIRF